MLISSFKDQILPPTPPAVRPLVADLQPQLVAWRRQFHQYPELGFQETLTAAAVAKALKSWGIPTQTEVAQTGVVALIEGAQPGPVLAIRADMDALPMQETNEVAYRSRHPQVMHACGHDGHTAIALGTAYLLQQARAHLKGAVKIIFQPAEERPGGAKPMIEAGVLDQPKVEAMIGLHLWNNLPLGTVGVKAGPSMANAAEFSLEIIGRGGHGAIPHQTIDAIVVGAQVVTAWQSIVARNVNPLAAAVVSVGQFQAGSVFNVIAPTALLKGTVRCFDPALATLLPERLEAIAAGICQAHGATYHFDYIPHYPAVINDGAIAALVETCARDLMGQEGQVAPEVTLGGEDMAFFLAEVPGCYFFLGSANAAAGLDYPHHHPRFDFDERALGLGVEMFLRCVERYLRVSLP